MNTKRATACTLIVALATTGAITTGTSVIEAADGDIVISEVMYHAADGPSGDDSDYDYLELANVGASTVDLTGWSLTSGVEGNLDGVSIEPGGYVVIAKSADGFESRYGFRPDREWTDGNLSNGGETVELRDASGGVADSLTYSDDDPWSDVADGDGPSLERLELATVNSGSDPDAANWPSSRSSNGTPGAPNSVLRYRNGFVVFSEVMYHAAEDEFGEDTPYDFVELTNVGDVSVDLTGWEFTDGVESVLDPMSIAPGDFIVVAEDAAAFEERYGFAPDTVWSGGSLSNGGETVELSNGLGVVVDRLAYTDDPPWPGAADGSGRSLERRDLNLPNVGSDIDAANWLASGSTFGTPRAPNSVLTAGPAIIDVNDGDERPPADAGIVVSAEVLNAEGVVLDYMVGFSQWVTIEMLDDEASAGGAGDGVYTAVLPAQPARTLVRYVVTATNAQGMSTSPEVTDAVPSHGLVVADPTALTDLPALDYFITDDDYALLLGAHRYTDNTSPIVLAYGDQVIDGATIRVRGGITRDLPKPSMRIELPPGVLISFDELDEPVDEFNLFRRYDIATDLGWEIADELDVGNVDFFGLRVYRNGDFWSTGAYLTATDGRWRDSVGYDDAAVYKAEQLMKRESNPKRAARQWEKDEGVEDDFSDVWEFTKIVDSGNSDEQYSALMESLDVPAVINYWAYTSLLNQQDGWFKNFYLIRDPEGTGRWHLHPWDLLLIGNNTGRLWGDFRMPIIEALNRYPEFREMHARRLKSIRDSYSAQDLVDEYNARYAAAEDALWDNYAVWDQGSAPDVVQRSWVNGVPKRFAAYDRKTEPVPGRGLPASQSSTRPIAISAVNAASAEAPASVELTNTSDDESFDLSGWYLSLVDVTLPQGTVLLPQASLYVTSDDVEFRAVSEGLFAVVEFDGLPDQGLMTLFDTAGGEVDAVSYGNDDVDGDGVVNDEDNCLVDPNPDQADADGDGVGDVCDSDPEDGPAGDVDGDGVVNDEDNCLVDPNPDQADADGDGVGDICDDHVVVPGTEITVDGVGTAPTVTIMAMDGALGVSWLAVDNAEKYRYRVRQGGGPWSKWMQVGSQLGVQIDGLTNGLEYTVALSTRVGGKWRNERTEATLTPLTLDDGGDADGDVDGDGVVNGEDNCLVDPNPDQADADGDGVGDICDDVVGNVDSVEVDGVDGVRPTVRVVIHEGRLDVAWDSVVEATIYQLRWRRWRHAWNTEVPADYESYTLDHTTEGAAYTIQVRAVVDGKYGPWTEVVAVAS